MRDIGVEVMPAHERILTNIGRQISAGIELRRPDQLAAMSAAAASVRDYYGPGPASMTVASQELPETVKGVLAGYVL